MRSAASWVLDRAADALIILGVIWALVAIGAASFGL